METPTTPSSGLFQGASPKLTFLFGMAIGVGVTALISLSIFFFTDRTAKVATTNTATTNSADGTVTYGDVKEVSKDDYIRGDEKAGITLISYTDLECPFCKSFHPTTAQILDEYEGKVNMVFRHFPLSFHANAPKQAEAALCVGELAGDEKYFTYIDKIFERTTSNGTGFALTALAPLAKELGVNETKFKECLDSNKMASRVTEEMNDGSQAGATGTPTTFVVKDGKTITAIPGAYSLSQVKTIIDQALAS